MKMIVQQCSLCGRKVRGPAFYRHNDACRKKHGQASGKAWRAKAWSVCRRFGSTLRAMALSPAEHEALEREVGKKKAGGRKKARRKSDGQKKRN